MSGEPINQSVTAFAPATIANFNSGFDVLGLALTEMGDTVTLTPNELSENRIVAIENGAGLPMEADKNCCTAVITAMQRECAARNTAAPFVDVRIHKGIPAGSGLGSSSASSAAAAVAYHDLIGKPFSETALVRFAGVGEALASGAIHFDNIAPAMLGGMTLCSQSSSQPFMRLPVPTGLSVVVIFPQVKINTADARKVLPDIVALNVVTKQMANIATTVRSLYENDVVRLGESLQDLLATPTRKALIPHFDEIESRMHNFGALAYGISGSGPTTFALIEQEKDVSTLLVEIGEMFEADGLDCQIHHFALEAHRGAHVVKK